MEKTPIILLTGTCKFDNLIYLAKDINRYYKEFSNYFDIYWIICKDQYNGQGSLDSFFEYISTTNIYWQMYDSGKPNQKNYGGSLYNQPLKNFIESYNINNPFVYIFDDDNLIHPNLFPTLKLFQQINFDNKEIIVLNCVFQEGYIKPLYERNINVINKHGWIDGMNVVDPSATLLRYSIIKKYGMYVDDPAYDYKWLLPLMSVELENNNILTNLDFYRNKVIDSLCGIRNAYHNHLYSIKDTTNIDLYKDINLDDIIIDINISKRYDKQPYPKTLDIPILSNENKEKIKQIIYSEIEKFQK